VETQSKRKTYQRAASYAHTIGSKVAFGFSPPYDVDFEIFDLASREGIEEGGGTLTVGIAILSSICLRPRGRGGTGASGSE
jgi:hypothetical protein